MQRLPVAVPPLLRLSVVSVVGRVGGRARKDVLSTCLVAADPGDRELDPRGPGAGRLPAEAAPARTATGGATGSLSQGYVVSA